MTGQRNYTSASYAREMDGILLSSAAGVPEHREIKDAACREVVLRMGDAQFLKLVEEARRLRLTPSALALRLLEAGAVAHNTTGEMHAERCGADLATHQAEAAKWKAEAESLHAQLQNMGRKFEHAAASDEQAHRKLNVLLQERDAARAELGNAREDMGKLAHLEQVASAQWRMLEARVCELTAALDAEKARAVAVTPPASPMPNRNRS